MSRQRLTAIVGITLASILLVDAGELWARARGGGSRGSRSYSAPVRRSPSPGAPTTPSRSFGQPAAPATPAPQRPGLFGGLMGGLAGLALGGLLGSLLFGGGLGGGSGIGLMELLLIGGGLFFLWSFLKRRRGVEQPAYAAATGYGGSAHHGAGATTSDGADDRHAGHAGAASAEVPAVEDRSDLERGLAHVRQMDPGFDPAAFADWARGQFAPVQHALTARDAGPIRDRLTPEMYGVLLTQCDELRSAGRTNRVEDATIARAEVTEAWQETGRDFVTVCLAGSLVDYTMDDRTGRVVDGSTTEAQRFEEYWTFTRPVGANPWRLSAIQT